MEPEYVFQYHWSSTFKLKPLFRLKSGRIPTSRYFPFSAIIAAPACSSGFKPFSTAEILPSGLITNVVRSIPIYFLPYMLFSFITPYLLQTALSSSASSEYGRSYFSLNFFWAEGLSAEMPNTIAPARWIFWNASRNPHASIVQPGVLALG